MVLFLKREIGVKKSKIIFIMSSLFVSNAVIAISINKKLYHFSKKKYFLPRIKEVVEKEGANVNYRSWQGHTPLMRAAARGDLDLVKYFLSKGALAEHSNRAGQTALHKAAEKGNLSVIKLLIKHGVRVNIMDKNDNIALHYAAKENHEKVVRYLVKKGSAVVAQNKDGKRPVDLIRNTGTAKFLRAETAKRMGL